MTTSNHPVTSREYKLMLNVDRFKDREKGSVIFFRLLDFLITKKDRGKIIKAQNEEEKRLTSYLDTPELALRQQGFSLRLREEAKAEDGFQITLKYRAADRYISASRDLSSPLTDKIKFEEDILPPFISKFSHSTTVKVPTNPDLNSTKKVVAVFPGLKKVDLSGEDIIKTVNDFKAIEVVRKLCKFQFGEPPEIKASLSFWYLPGTEDDWPLVAEFSLNYDMLSSGTDGNTLEMYPSQVVEGANRLFSALQNQSGWVNFHTTTKTAFALEGM